MFAFDEHDSLLLCFVLSLTYEYQISDYILYHSRDFVMLNSYCDAQTKLLCQFCQVHNKSVFNNVAQEVNCLANFVNLVIIIL